jgi:hypothetical protein
MTEYTITIDGYRSGLTENAIEQSFREQFGSYDVTITVEESSTDE